jgi:methyltransferase (TIGR00027 family)
MQPGRSSRTAMYNALFRALEGQRGSHTRLFVDPLAARFLTAPLAAVVGLAKVPGGAALVHRYIDHRWPGVRTSVVARTCLIDDTINNTLDRRTAKRWQFVALGAGFDTRPHRLTSLRQALPFEVDHPDTQTAKRARLAGAGAVARTDIRYIATDFNVDQRCPLLEDHEYDATAPTIIVWEGVTNYLNADAVDATLRWCSTVARGSILIFTYIDRNVIDDPSSYVGTHNLAKSLARSGEPLTFGIDPQQLPGFLADRGFRLLSDRGASDYRLLYYGDCARNMRGHEFYRVAVAGVERSGQSSRSTEAAHSITTLS